VSLGRRGLVFDRRAISRSCLNPQSTRQQEFLSRAEETTPRMDPLSIIGKGTQPIVKAKSYAARSRPIESAV
jgi:hypothetical protein